MSIAPYCRNFRGAGGERRSVVPNLYSTEDRIIDLLRSVEKSASLGDGSLRRSLGNSVRWPARGTTPPSKIGWRRNERRSIEVV